MHHSLEHLLTIPSFVLWIKGECSPREQEYWDKWLSEDPAHEPLARRVEEIVEAARSSVRWRGHFKVSVKHAHVRGQYRFGIS